MSSTIPAAQSVDEAQHWITLEAHFGDPRSIGVREALRGHRLPSESREWLEDLSSDPEVGQWCEKLIERIEK